MRHLFDAGTWLCPSDVRIEVQMSVTSVNCAWDSSTDMELHHSLKPVHAWNEARQEQSYASLHAGSQTNVRPCQLLVWLLKLFDRKENKQRKRNEELTQQKQGNNDVKKTQPDFLKCLYFCTTNEFCQSIDDIHALHLHQCFDKSLDCEVWINLNDVFQ